MIKAEIILDSKNTFGDRVTTFKLTFPRYILAELNTHRMFSKNSASSRAIPFKKMVKMVQENPFVPIAWQKDHKGMQGSEYYTDEDTTKFDIPQGFSFKGKSRIGKYSEYLEYQWLSARDKAVDAALQLNNCRVTKQLCNRLLEPFMWHTVLLTTTGEGLQNFFELRCPQYEYSPDMKYFKSKKEWIKYCNIYEGTRPTYESDIDWFSINKGQADIHMMELAECMYDIYNESEPKLLGSGQWHIPFGNNFDEDKIENTWRKLSKMPENYIHDTKIKISIARCARISYETLGDEPKIDYEADLRLYQTLLESKHYSPTEHVCCAMNEEEYSLWTRGKLHTIETPFGKKDVNDGISEGWCRNYKGFIQYRELC